jgi:hypothetical protein
MERAAASGYGIVLSDIDAPVVARICRRLDGIALAIELAASRVGSLAICGTAELLDNRFGLLWHGRRTVLPRHEKHVLADGACGRCETVSLLCQQMGSGGFLARDGDRTCSAWDPAQYALSDVHRNSHDEAVLRKCWSSRQTCCHGSSWADWEPSRICGRNRLSCQRCSRAHDGRIAGRRWRLDRRLTGTIRGCEVVSCSPISHEREVVTHVVESLMNKQIAAKIAITEITVR